MIEVLATLGAFCLVYTFVHTPIFLLVCFAVGLGLAYWEHQREANKNPHRDVSNRGRPQV